MLKMISVTIILISLLSGCSTPISTQRLITDENWSQLGFNKGQRGENPVAELALQKTVSEVNDTVNLDYDTYLKGYQKGLESYCSLEQLRQMGLEMKMDWGVCEFRREGEGLYQVYWKQGFDRSMSSDGGW
ncbi:DUF2799 domain-containing protein [Photobacterium sanguinicancri]|uniref:DUF2799 domain-containing protein n=2 Tax=Photobacterium sanguinicancri TaxID=875932 RepID=UPI0026E15DA2|nr:DUF2799 domain-containing protein [Photobacterium sanguinicancri]MDO6500989.1 DUF2799 domain-containing protein [Photobacterium sanguinicancri]